MHCDCQLSQSLKENSGIGLIADKRQDKSDINGLSHLSRYFSPSACEIMYSIKQSERNDIISCERKEAVPLFLRLLIVSSLSIV